MFNHLKVPESWNSYFSKYPNGLTIMEALVDWVGQVDSMVDHINTVDEHIDYLNKNLEEFYLTFQENLSQEIMKTLQAWIEDGTLGEVIAQLVEGRMVFQNIQALQSAPNVFKLGTVVELLGFYTAGDGAGHKRIISDSDDGSGVQVGSKWANIVFVSDVNVKFFGAKGDGVSFDTDKIQKAIDYAFSKESVLTVYLPAGKYITTTNLILKRKQATAGVNDFWNRNATILLGEDAQNTFIIKKTTETGIDATLTEPLETAVGSGIQVRKLTIKNESTRLDSYCIYIHKRGANDIFVDLNLYNPLGRGILSEKQSFSNTFENMRIFVKENALYTTDDGTSNYFKNIYCAGVKDPYRFDGVYSEATNIFGDGCTGIFIQHRGNLTIGSVGAESPLLDAMFLSGFRSNLKVDTVFNFLQTNPESTFIQLSGQNENIDIGQIKFYDIDALGTKFNFIKAPDGVNLGDLLLNIRLKEWNSFFNEIPTNNHPDSKIVIGESVIRFGRAHLSETNLGASVITNLTGKQDALQYGGSSNVSVRWLRGYKKGDILLENDVNAVNTALNVCTVSANDVNGSTIKKVQPVISGGTTSRPTSDLFVGLMYFDTTLKKPIFYSGSNWVDSEGVTV